MNKTAAEIAKIKNCSRQAAQKYIAQKKIQPAGKKGAYPTYDCAAEPLKTYLTGKKNNTADTEPPTADTEPEPLHIAPPPPQNTDTTARIISKPLNDLLNGKTPSGVKASVMLYAESLQLAKKNEDAGQLLKLAQAAAKEDAEEEIRLQLIKTAQAKEQIEIEKAERLKIENDIRRGKYIELETVKLLFGRVYAVHTSVLQPLSLKLASTLAAIPDGAKKEAAIKKIIDDEIFAALASIQRNLVDFVTAGDIPLDKPA